MARRKKGKKATPKSITKSQTNSGKSRSGKGIKQGDTVTGVNSRGRKFTYRDDLHKRDALTGKYIDKPGESDKKASKTPNKAKTLADKIRAYQKGEYSPNAPSKSDRAKQLAQRIRDYQSPKTKETIQKELKSLIDEKTKDTNPKSSDKAVSESNQKNADSVSKEPQRKARPEESNQTEGAKAATKQGVIKKTTAQVRDERVKGLVGKETDEGFMPTNSKLTQPKANKFEAGLNSITRDTLDSIKEEDFDSNLKKTLNKALSNYEDETEKSVIAQFLISDQPTKTQQKLADKVRKKLLAGETDNLLTEKQMISAKNTMIKHFEKGKVKGNKADSVSLAQAQVESQKKVEKQAKTKEKETKVKKTLDERIANIEKFVTKLEDPEVARKVAQMMRGEIPLQPIVDNTKSVSINGVDKKVDKHPLATGELETMTIEQLSEALNEIYTGKGDNEIEGRVERFKEFVTKNDSFQATEVSINSRGQLTIKDGRHRAKALSEMGVKDIPVVVSREAMDIDAADIPGRRGEIAKELKDKNLKPKTREITEEIEPKKSNKPKAAAKKPAKTKTKEQKVEDGDILFKDKESADKLIDSYVKDVEMTYSDHKYAKQTGIEPRLIKLARKLGYSLDIREGRSPSTKGFAEADKKRISITPSGLKESPDYINAIMRHELIHAIQGNTGTKGMNLDSEGKATTKQITPLGLDYTQHLSIDEAFRAMGNYAPHKWTTELEAFVSNKAQLGGEDLSAQALATSVYRDAKGLNKDGGYKTDVNWWKEIIKEGESRDKGAYIRAVVRNAAQNYPELQQLVDTDTPRLSAKQAKTATNKLSEKEKEAAAANTDVTRPKEKQTKKLKEEAKQYTNKLKDVVDNSPLNIDNVTSKKYGKMIDTFAGNAKLKEIKSLMKSKDFKLQEAFDMIEALEVSKGQSKDPNITKLVDASIENIKVSLFKGLSNLDDSDKNRAIGNLPIAPTEYSKKTQGLLSFYI